MAVKQVIVLRRDLNMRKGKMIAQGAHASVKWLSDLVKDMYGRGNVYDALTEEERDWLEGAFTKVCVGVDSKDELDEICSAAIVAGLTVNRIVDNGATEFHGVPTLTCCAIGPNKSEEIDKITGGLKLL